MKIERLKMIGEQKQEEQWWKVEKGKAVKPIVPLTQEQKEARKERFKKANDEAVGVIFADVVEKVKVAEEEGKDQVIVYTFGQLKDKVEVVDEKGIRVVFGERVRLIDILIKGYYHFMVKARSLLNKEDEQKYRIGYFKNANEDVWNIFVSWRSLEKKVVEKKVYTKNLSKKPYVKKSFVKKQDDGMMMSTKIQKVVVETKKSDPNSWAGRLRASL